MGAHLSAYTSREHTAYYMKTLSKDLPKGKRTSKLVSVLPFKEAKGHIFWKVHLEELKKFLIFGNSVVYV